MNNLYFTLVLGLAQYYWEELSRTFYLTFPVTLKMTEYN